MKHKFIHSIQWSKYFFGISFLIMAAIFVFNLLIDPYGTQNYICAKEYKPILNERADKYGYIFYENKIREYDGIILGSSRVMKMVPSNYRITESYYNFGLSVCNNAEKLFLIKEWLKKKPLKKVYLGVDFFSFYSNVQPLFVDYGKFQKQRFHLDNYMTPSTFKLSWQSMMNQFTGNKRIFFNDDGSVNYFYNDLLIKQKSYDFSQKRFRKEADLLLKSLMTEDSSIEEEVFALFYEIKALSEQNGFDLNVFITPMQQEVHEVLMGYPKLTDEFNYIRDRLVTIFGTVYDFSTAPENSIRENFYDPYHYRENLGNAIIQRLNGTGNYGRLLHLDSFHESNEPNMDQALKIH